MWIDIKTEYSFKSVYGQVDKIVSHLAEDKKIKSAGIADLYNTFGHIPWEKACKKAGIKPIFGVKLPVTESSKNTNRYYRYDIMTFVAKNNEGLRNIYKLVELAHSQFYWRPLVTYEQIQDFKSGVAIISGVSPHSELSKCWDYEPLSPSTPNIKKTGLKSPIAMIDNSYILRGDMDIYEAFADERLLERKTFPQHILTKSEWASTCGNNKLALKNLKKLMKTCNVELQKAPMVKVDMPKDLKTLCVEGATRLGVDLKDPVYSERLNRELGLIADKKYEDYFLIVQDMIVDAKNKMLVAPGRGSSAGSLVCYLIGITEVMDPIKFDLIFERFLDPNRGDLPDIDTDFQDDKRSLVLNYARRKYGADNVAQVANISRLKPKSALNRIAKNLCVSNTELDEIKEVIIERESGDSRASNCIEDTFRDTDKGQLLLAAYPQLSVCSNVENHASHMSVHAAGLLIGSEKISNYCGINSRDNKNIAMVDKKTAEYSNLLKIDCLGLKTLTVISQICAAVGVKPSSIYGLPLNDKKTFKLLGKKRLDGVFQLDGEAIKRLAEDMPIENFEDIYVLSAIGRPGPLSTGGAQHFVERRSGREKVKYPIKHKVVKKILAPTYGTIVYQEQVMSIAREYAGLSWPDVTRIRVIIGKTQGSEALGEFREKFIAGGVKNGSKVKAAEKLWNQMVKMGKYLFNKSHAVSYGLISYYCAYYKANHPLEFAIACLNNESDDRKSVRILRDLIENQSIEYHPPCTKKSQSKWAVVDGKVYAGLITIDGIGLVSANKIVKSRESGVSISPAMKSKVENGESFFNHLYPAREVYGNHYKKGAMKISSIKKASPGRVYLIGCLIERDLRDINDPYYTNLRMKDGGEREVPGPSKFLNMKVEDDTGMMTCTVVRKMFPEIGEELMQDKEGKTWYKIYGSYNARYDKTYIDVIENITKRKN